jgi:hypothetical protein
LDSSKFGSKVIEDVGYYVYVLVDPRTEQPFYIGKGKGSRVFSHELEADENEIESSKLQQIRDIRAEGLQVRKQLVRHAMTEKESLLAESVLIDFLKTYDVGLTNIVAGHHTSAFGMMTVEEITRKYVAPPLEHLEDGFVIININKRYREAKGNADFYEVTRGSWVIHDDRISSLKYALAEYKGFIVEAFEIESDGWHKDEASGRWTFSGCVASDSVRSRYLNRRIYKAKGTANPISYRLQVPKA